MTRCRSPALPSLMGYLAVFAVSTHAWWSTATYAVPPGNDLRDSRFIVWVLGWVAHALVTAPSRLFDAPIFFPAPAQLAGSEHFLSAQLLFAPLYWAGGNPVLAANLTALSLYPLSAFAMERLLAAQGIGRGSAWFGGLAFALGVLRVPASLHVLQYPALFLPLVALRLQRAREHPSPRTAMLLGAVLLVGMFTSYYLAVLLGVATAIWGTFELVRAGAQRVRMLALVGAALATSGVALAWFSRPYFHRLSAFAGDTARDDLFWTAAGRSLLAAALDDPVWVVMAALAVGGALANAGRSARRGLVVTALAFIAAGVLLLVLGWPWPLKQSLGFFRDRTRYLLLASFGFNVLVALGYDSLRARLVRQRWAGVALCLALTSALVGTRMHLLALASDPILAVTRDGDQYARVAELFRRQGPGPVLELPYVSTLLVDRVPEQMVGQLRHGMPLVNGYTGYRPPHVPLLESLIRTLPATPALDDLVDMTHLRWIVVRPEDEWDDAGQRRRFLAALARHPARGPSYSVGSWIVQRIDRTPQHHVWFDAIAARPRVASSALGTPLGSIPEPDAIASISARVSPGPVLASWFVGIEASASNRGAAGWPAWTGRGWTESGLVHWQARWRRAEDGAEWSAPHAFPLRRDVGRGETLMQPLIVPTPPEPGAYELQITLVQQDGARFSAARNQAGRIRLDVAPPRR